MTALSESFYLKTPFLGRSRPHCSLVGLENPFLTLARTSHLHQKLLQVMCHLFPHQTRVPQTLWTSQATSDSQEALEFHFHGFHREAPSIFWLHLHSSHC